MARTAPCSGVLLSECFYNEVSDTLSKCLILYLIIYVVIPFFYPVLMLMEDWGQVGCRRKRGALITKLETRGEQRMQKNQQKERENSGSHTDGLSVVGIIRKPYSCDRENSSECDLKSEQRLKKPKKQLGRWSETLTSIMKSFYCLLCVSLSLKYQKQLPTCCLNTQQLIFASMLLPLSDMTHRNRKNDIPTR